MTVQRWLDWLQCPCCATGAPLTFDGETLTCAACSGRYPVADGIPSFVGTPGEQESERRKRDEEVAVYDGLFSPVHNFIEIPPLVEELAPRASDHILDVGVGPGRVLREYVKRCSHVLAIDFSLESLRALRRSLHPSVRERVTLVHADACRLPVRPGRFDRAICSCVLQHLPDHASRRAAIEGVHRALVAGGRFVAEVYHWSRARQLAAGRTGGAGGRRAGRHSDDQIAYYNLSAEEMHGLVTPLFRVRRMFGLMQDMRGLHRLGVLRPVVERLVEHTPLSLWTGQMLVVTADRVSQARETPSAC